MLSKIACLSERQLLQQAYLFNHASNNKFYNNPISARGFFVRESAPSEKFTLPFSSYIINVANIFLNCETQI